MKQKLIFNRDTSIEQYEELFNLKFGDVFKIERDYETVMRRITEDYLPKGSEFEVSPINPGTSLFTVYGSDHLVVVHEGNL